MAEYQAQAWGQKAFQHQQEDHLPGWHGSLDSQRECASSQHPAQNIDVDRPRSSHLPPHHLLNPLQGPIRGARSQFGLLISPSPSGHLQYPQSLLLHFGSDQLNFQPDSGYKPWEKSSDLQSHSRVATAPSHIGGESGENPGPKS